MITKLTYHNVGPLSEQTISFSQRLNVITGDNGIGKTFLLDSVWYAMTRKWLREVNPGLLTGYKARPNNPTRMAQLVFNIVTGSGKKVNDYCAVWSKSQQTWSGKPGRPYSPGIVLYAHSDGGFSVWDQARNYWRKKGTIDIQDRPPAFVFSQSQVWEGLRSEGKNLCNGLLQDWCNWQRNESGKEFGVLRSVLERLSPPDTPLRPGPIMRMSIDDVSDVPSVCMPYGNIPLPEVSAGIRRIAAFAYFLTWAFREHVQACRLLGTKPSSQITFLVDEIESHLHPRWQRTIISALLAALKGIQSDRDWLPDGKTANIQLIVATHSPLFMTALEDEFDNNLDRWIDLDYADDKRKGAIATERKFIPQGDTNGWLTSEAFDLRSARSPNIEREIDAANRLLENENALMKDLVNSYRRLARLLPVGDPAISRFQAFLAAKKATKQ